MKPLVEKGEQETIFRLYGSRPRTTHFLIALLTFAALLAVFYLIGIGDRGVWLGLSILFGFVLVWGWLSYREAKGTVIRVTGDGLSLPASATPSRSERVLSSPEIRTVCLILLRSRRGDRRLSILEIEQANGKKLRLWPSMVSTEALARAMEQHMGITVSSRSGIVYQIILGILAFGLLFGIALLLVTF